MRSQLKVTLIADEYFSWGLYGGYGAFTRKFGSELAKRGVEVEALVQKVAPDQKPVGESEVIDGVIVRTLPRGKKDKLFSKMYSVDSDIIHSQCGELDTYLAFRANGSAVRIATVQDLRTDVDLHRIGSAERNDFKRRVGLDIARYLYGRALNAATRIYAQADLLVEKINEMYGIDRSRVRVMPNFVNVPQENAIKKTERPSVVWLGRLDPIKRYALCFELANNRPDVDFYILGKSHEEAINVSIRRSIEQAQLNGKQMNIHMLGFDAGQLKEETLSKAWILINTSIYECMPVSFLEGMAHKCALLSTQDPDGYATSFGAWVPNPTVESLNENLDFLLKEDMWKFKGELGYKQAVMHHETDKCMKDTITLYGLLSKHNCAI